MQEILRNTLRKILLALIRILLRNGMSYGEFDQIARKCFVDVAFDDFSSPKKKQTISNVAILTGLNRKEVKKMHELDVDQSGGTQRKMSPLGYPLFAVIGGAVAKSQLLKTVVVKLHKRLATQQDRAYRKVLVRI